MWVQSSGGGSKRAEYTRRSGASWLADFSASITTSSSSTNIELHIGCGGTTSTWGSNNKTKAVAVSGSKSINVRCNDVKSTNGYRCRNWEAKSVLVGMPFDGRFDSFGLSPTTSHHTSGDVSMDLYAPSGTGVKVYAYAPKGVTLKLKTSGAPTSTCGRGENVTVNVYWNGEKIGWFKYGHLKSIPSTVRASGATLSNGTTIGATSTWAKLAGCWEVSTAAGVHTHYTAYNEKNYACMAPYSKKDVAVGRWIGIVGHGGATSAKRYCAA